MSSPSPAPLLPILPDDLTEWDQWVLWRLETRDGKPTKVPYQVTGERAKSDDPATWGSFETVCAAWTAAAARYQGIGFVFGEHDPFAGIDLDDCLDDAGELKAWARSIIERFADTYMEISPSGRGVKIWARARLEGRGRRAQYRDGAIEVYDRGRFFTTTGRRFREAVLQIEDHQADVVRLCEFISQRGPGGPKHTGPKADLISQGQVTEGARYHYLQSVAAQYRARGMDRDEIYAALVAINQKRCVPPKADAALRELADWTATLEPGRRRVIQMPPPTGHPANAGDIPLPPAPEAGEGGKAADASEALSPLPASGEGGEEMPRVSFDQGGVSPPLPEAGGGSEVPNLLPFPFTDTGNAERLVALSGRDIRYCVEMKKWLVWDGKRWAVDGRGAVKQLATKMARQLYVQAADIADADFRKATEKWARASESAGGISRTLECAQHQPGIPISTAQLDTHGMLLNCLNGVIDLSVQPAKLRPHQRDLYLTKLCHHRFKADAQAPRFIQFIRRIMGDNPDAELSETTARLVSYLQRALGYSLTGDVSAKVVFCFFGKGNNGKTTLLEAFRHLLAEFSCQINIDTLMQKPGGENNATLADLADLRGARFVTTSEADEGQKLKAGKLKYLSAGMGSIKTMRKYENAIEFPATHKLFLDANHKPVLPANDDATWNRVRPVPFTVVVPPEEIDLQLLEKLKAEAEGILAWAVRGCALWQQQGLDDPLEVRDAGTAWRTASDPLADFFADCCTLHPETWCKSSDLWKRYERWAEENGEKYLLSRVKFGERLEAAGCRPARRRFSGVLTRSWEGIGIKTEFSDE